MKSSDVLTFKSIVHRTKYYFKRSYQIITKEGFLNFISKFVKIIFEGSKINLDKIQIHDDTNLDKIFLKFGTDKGSLDGKKTYLFLESRNPNSKYKNYLDWINRENPESFEYQFGYNFTQTYEKLFENIRFNKLKILEIGVANGHSAASWVKYFPNSMIYATDVKKSFKFFYKSKRLRYDCLDCYNVKKVKKYIKKFKYFDVIIEDADHLHHSMSLNIKNYFPAVKSGGYYILEDFFDEDDKLRKYKDYNAKYGKRLMRDWSVTMEEVFENIKNKTFFEHPVFNKSDQEYLFQNVESVEIVYGDHPFSSLGILKKK